MIRVRDGIETIVDEMGMDSRGLIWIENIRGTRYQIARPTLAGLD
jgi:hypothetical protein